MDPTVTEPNAGPQLRELRRPDLLRSIPPVHRIVDLVMAGDGAADAPRWIVTTAVRQTIAKARGRLESDGPAGSGTGVGGTDVSPVKQSCALAEITVPFLVTSARSLLTDWAHLHLEPAINATGVLLHTGLGRAPLASAAVKALASVAGRYAMVELDQASGGRGRRENRLAEMLTLLTGAPAGTVVNNNAAALMLTVSTLAVGRRVVVSRGELVEIGGSFRLPEIIQAAGAELREVGTTNRTRPRDFDDAIDDDVGLILKVHTSNYRIEGFTQEASVEDLVEIGSRRNIPVAYDIGSGLLSRRVRPDELVDEPVAQDSIRAGADLTLFSGDKLLGGPQCGVILGKQSLVDRIRANPMMRAMRIDKLTIAALAATLEIHMDPDRAMRELPVLAAARDRDALRQRTERLVESVGRMDAVASAEQRQTSASIGGGSAPGVAIPSLAVAISLTTASEQEFADLLRLGAPTVVARVNGGRVLLDLSGVFPEQDADLLDALAAACHAVAADDNERAEGCDQ